MRHSITPPPATAAAVKMQKHHHQPRINLSMKIPTFPPPIDTIIFIIDWTILVAWTVSTIIEYHQGIIWAYLIGLIYSQLIWCKLNVVMWLLRNAGMTTAAWSHVNEAALARVTVPANPSAPVLVCALLRVIAFNYSHPNSQLRFHRILI